MTDVLTTGRSRTTSVRRGVAAGAVAGLVAGIITALMLQVKGGLAPGLFTIDFPKYGGFWQVAVVVAAGAGYGALFQRYRGAYAAAISGGVLVGLMAWIIVALTLLPFLSGDQPTWGLAAVAATFPYLIGLLFGCGLTGLLSYLALLGWQRRTPVAPPARDQIAPVRIVVLGGGFGGVACAQGLEKRFLAEPHVEVTLVSQSNYLLFTPMLAEVASSSLQASNISAPVRAASPRSRFVRAEVGSIDLESRELSIDVGGSAAVRTLPFDHLVLGLGAVPAFFDDGVAAHAFTLKTLQDASRLRAHVLAQLEVAEVEDDPAIRAEMLTFVVAGGGFAGTELIAELFDLVHSVGKLFPRLDREQLRFILIHSRDRILPELSRGLAEYAQDKLTSRGIELVLGKRVASATRADVSLTDGTRIPTRTLVWTAGNQPNPVLRDLPVELDRGAVVCDTDLRVRGLTDVWAVGDCARIPDPDTPASYYPPTAQHALRQGKVLAGNIHAVVHGKPTKPFRFKTIGVLVALGHRTAAAEVYGRRFSGLLAWFMWRGIYLSKLPGLEKKTRVAFDWTLDTLFPRDIVLEDPPTRTQETR